MKGAQQANTLKSFLPSNIPIKRALEKRKEGRAKRGQAIRVDKKPKEEARRIRSLGGKSHLGKKKKKRKTKKRNMRPWLTAVQQPNPTNKINVNLYMDAKLAAAIEVLADVRGVFKTTVVKEALSQYFADKTELLPSFIPAEHIHSFTNITRERAGEWDPGEYSLAPPKALPIEAQEKTSQGKTSPSMAPIPSNCNVFGPDIKKTDSK